MCILMSAYFPKFTGKVRFPSNTKQICSNKTFQRQWILVSKSFIDILARTKSNYINFPLAPFLPVKVVLADWVILDHQSGLNSKFPTK